MPAEQGTSHFYYHYDGRGNVTQLTDADQTTVARYTYDAFGNTHASGSQANQPYRFSTKEQHAYSGLYDYGYRFYSPGLGRWINRDPIAEQGGLNLYGFVYNNPVNLIDSDGRIVIALPVLVIGLAVLAAILAEVSINLGQQWIRMLRGCQPGGGDWDSLGEAIYEGLIFGLLGGLAALLGPATAATISIGTLLGIAGFGTLIGLWVGITKELIFGKCKGRGAPDLGGGLIPGIVPKW